MRKNTILGVITIILSLIVSSALFVQVVQYLSSEKISNAFLIILVTDALSVLVTTLSILQVFLKYSELAENCKTISSRYGFIKREIEILMTKKSIMEEALDESLNRINIEMVSLAEDSPHIPAHIYKKVKRSLSKDPIQHPLFTEKTENKDATKTMNNE